MNIERAQAEMLKRFFLNADPFLWGILLANNKKEVINNIKKLQFLEKYSENANFTYQRIGEDLLIELGIEGILERIVSVKIHEHFSKDVLQNLRRYWEQGHRPGIDFLEKNSLYKMRRITLAPASKDDRLRYRDPADVFFEINKEYGRGYLERWTVFAGLWFETIEPLL